MIAKGRIFITAESLKEMFNLPDDVEFLTVERQDAHEGQGGVEFVIASKEPIEGLTLAIPSWTGMNIRRVRVPLPSMDCQHEKPKPLVYDQDDRMFHQKGFIGGDNPRDITVPMPSQKLGFGNDFLTRETGFGVSLK